MNPLPPPEPDLLAQFQTPSAAFRGKPFWSWNGRLEKEELLRQVHVFKAMGMGGFFMHSRTGLQTQYLGKEWFELINACADEAEKLGLEAWLYDEDRWPSGSAGGLATENPEYRLKSLRLTTLPGARFEWPPQGEVDIVAVFEATLDGLNYSQCRQVAPGEAVAAHAHALVFTTETTRNHTFYNGNTYLDTLKREATDHFIAVTHERYRQNCGDRLGHSIRGIFTDEPHHGMVMCHNTETRQDEQPEWTTPFTDALFTEFEKRFGYDLRPRLPELFLFRGGARISQVKWHYMELLQQLFLENWAQPLQNWCRQNGLRLTGHVLHEDSLAAQAVPCGSLMRYYEFLDDPGIDVLGNDNRNFWIAKQLSSAARQMGKPWMLSELYGCSGWQLDFAGHKEIGAWQALHGINLRCHHLSWYTMGGEAKRDYPASIFFQSAWHGQYSAVEDYFSRLHVVLQRGAAVCDVLVLNPIESLWAQIHAGWATWLCSKSPAIELIEDRYRRLFTWLSRAHVDFDYGDEDHLARFGSIELDADHQPLLRLGQCTYRVVVLGGMETIRSSSLALLEKFRRAGGKVIFAGEPPSCVDALPSNDARDLAEAAERVAFREELLIAAVCQTSRVPVRIAQDQPDAATDLLCQVRREGDVWFVVIVNTSHSAAHDNVEIRFDFDAPVEEWDCATGARYLQPAFRRNSALVWRTDVPALGERVFVLGRTPDPTLSRRPSPRREVSIPLIGPFRFSLDEPNICVLDFAEYQLGARDWQPPTEILKIDQAVRAKLGLAQRGGTMIQPWARPEKTAAQTAEASPVLRLRFGFQIETLPDEPIELLIETPGVFKISCNQTAIPCPAQPGWLIDPCFKRLPIALDALVPGRNVIELETAFSEGVDLEAIYLLGQFGVHLEGRTAALTRLPEKLLPCDVAAQGLPFYSGCISYEIPAGMVDPGRRIWLETGEIGGALAVVRAPGKAARCPVAWPPYEADVTELMDGNSMLICDVWLTRRNTFGPLHLAPKKQSHIGPDSFRSTGAAFSESYQLYASGLLQGPKLHIGAVEPLVNHLGVPRHEAVEITADLVAHSSSSTLRP